MRIEHAWFLKLLQSFSKLSQQAKDGASKALLAIFGIEKPSYYINKKYLDFIRENRPTNSGGSYFRLDLKTCRAIFKEDSLSAMGKLWALNLCRLKTLHPDQDRIEMAPHELVNLSSGICNKATIKRYLLILERLGVVDARRIVERVHKKVFQGVMCNMRYTIWTIFILLPLVLFKTANSSLKYSSYFPNISNNTNRDTATGLSPPSSFKNEDIEHEFNLANYKVDGRGLPSNEDLQFYDKILEEEFEEKVKSQQLKVKRAIQFEKNKFSRKLKDLLKQPQARGLRLGNDGIWNYENLLDYLYAQRFNYKSILGYLFCEVRDNRFILLDKFTKWAYEKDDREKLERRDRKNYQPKAERVVSERERQFMALHYGETETHPLLKEDIEYEEDSIKSLRKITINQQSENEEWLKSVGYDRDQIRKQLALGR